MNSILSLAGGIVAQALDPASSLVNVLDAGRGLVGASADSGCTGGSPGSFLGGTIGTAAGAPGQLGSIAGALA